MFTFITITEAHEAAAAAEAELDRVEMTGTIDEIAAAFTAYHEAMEDLTDTENELAAH